MRHYVDLIVKGFEMVDGVRVVGMFECGLCSNQNLMFVDRRKNGVRILDFS